MKDHQASAHWQSACFRALELREPRTRASCIRGSSSRAPVRVLELVASLRLGRNDVSPSETEDTEVVDAPLAFPRCTTTLPKLLAPVANFSRSCQRRRAFHDACCQVLAPSEPNQQHTPMRDAPAGIQEAGSRQRSFRRHGALVR